MWIPVIDEHPSTQQGVSHKTAVTTVKFVATFLYNTRPPLATLLRHLKSLELFKSLRGADEGK